jgi:hypothetical protein
MSRWDTKQANWLVGRPAGRPASRGRQARCVAGCPTLDAVLLSLYSCVYRHELEARSKGPQSLAQNILEHFFPHFFVCVVQCRCVRTLYC